jgi:ABC-type nickel/cobalt efflux system permease component RcnA
MRSRLVVFFFGACALVGALFALAPRHVAAHPLGNFTVNHYTRIDVSAQGIAVYRVLDMAEIPAIQERQRIDVDDNGAISEAEADAYATARAQSLALGLRLEVDGEVVGLERVSHALTFPDGEAGLSLLRLTVEYRAALPDDWAAPSTSVEFRDANDLDRIGWREVIVRGGPGVVLQQSTVPAVDVSSELTAYPEDLSSPLDVRSASFSVRPGAGASFPAMHPREGDAVRGNPDGALSGFTDLLANDLSAGAIALALLAAMAFGAYHALTPGHGKTIVAAYLIGSRGTARHAVLLGLVVTATHTSSVYVFGFIALYLSQYILPEDLYPWLGLASGGLILTMGLTLLAARLRNSGAAHAISKYVRSKSSAAFRAVRPMPALVTEAGAVASSATTQRLRDVDQTHSHMGHDHARAGGGHSHDDANHHHGAAHSHGFGPAHSHRIPGQDGEKVTLRSLIGLGIFGGMIPCPSAIVVMLGAIALHRVAFGLLLIVAFSVGLATVLTLIGFALVYAHAISRRVPLVRTLGAHLEGHGGAATATRLLPVASAMAVVGAGLVVTLRALTQQGVL